MHYSKYKTILSASNGMNIYRGCTHGCIYCDSRSSCYQMQHDFTDIEIKEDAAYILEEQLKRKRKPCMIATGSMCDPYIHLEEELGITRSCLELIKKYNFGVSILTKSSRIIRDIDILKSIKETTKCVVQLTLTTYDEDLCRILEPNVSTTMERVGVLQSMQDVGIPTVVWLSPILPFINDTRENLEGLLSDCIRAGVKGVVSFGFGTTMREGSREYFFSKLDENFPGMKQRYIDKYGNSYECLSPNNNILKEILARVCEEHNILYKYDEVFDYLHSFETKAKQMTLY